MKKYKRVLYFYILFFIGASLSFGLGYLIRAIQDTYRASQFPILEQAFDILKNHAYEEISDSKVIEYGMIRGMIDAYNDPYTFFEEPVQHELATDELEGKYGGIGANLEYDSSGFVILHPFPDSPAQKAGVLDGDQLIRVEEMEILPFTDMDTIVAALRGPEGEWVTIQISRLPESGVISFRIKREDFPIPSVSWHLDSEVQWLGIIRINLIAANTEEELIDAFSDLEIQGATHFILDLRDNRGGLLTEGIDIARLFLDNGEILQEQYRGQGINTYEVNKPGQLLNKPIVIIVNTNTASASEIIAGALQANKRAVIIGTQTFGKDTIQLVFDLQDGSSLHVTAAKWWIPGLGYEFTETGLFPDILIENPDSINDPNIEAARHIFLEQSKTYEDR